METYIINPLVNATGLSLQVCTYTAYGLILLVAVFVIQEFTRKTQGNAVATASPFASFNKPTKKERDRMLIIGPSGSGKTTLFNLLITG